MTKRYFHHKDDGKKNGWVVVLDDDKKTATTIYEWSEASDVSDALRWANWSAGVSVKSASFNHWQPCSKCQARKYMKRNNFKIQELP